MQTMDRLSQKFVVSICSVGAFYRASLLVQWGHWTYPILAAGHLQAVPWYILGIVPIADVLCSRDKLAILLITKHLSQEEAESTFVHAGGCARAVSPGFPKRKKGIFKALSWPSCPLPEPPDPVEAPGVQTLNLLMMLNLASQHLHNRVLPSATTQSSIEVTPVKQWPTRSVLLLVIGGRNICLILQPARLCITELYAEVLSCTVG